MIGPRGLERENQTNEKSDKKEIKFREYCFVTVKKFYELDSVVC